MERYDMRTANALSHACTRCLYATQGKCVRKMCVRRGVCVQLKTLSGRLHQCRHSNRNQRCHNSTVRIKTESFLRVTWMSSVRLSSGIRDNSNNHRALLTSDSCGLNTRLALIVRFTSDASEAQSFSSTDEKAVPSGILLIFLQLPMVHSALGPQCTSSLV